MIMNEDFVTFELAKKLKEKGFKEKCLAYYDVEDNVGLLYNTQYSDEALPCQYTDLLQCHNTGEAEIQPDDSENCVDAPTISQVLKWLREEKNIFVLIDIRTDLSFFYEIWCIEIALHPMGCVPFQKYQSYEQSALAGIEYVIDNLI